MTGTTTQTAADLAGILARGYDLHVQAHGPDGSYAIRTEDGSRYEVTETGAGATSYVESGGRRFAVTVTPLVSEIAAGTRVRLIDAPGARISNGSIGVAEGPPDSAGLFWAQFPAGSMHTRVSEVEIVRDDDVDRFADDDLTDRVKP